MIKVSSDKGLRKLMLDRIKRKDVEKDYNNYKIR